MRLSSLLAALVVLPLGPNSQTPNASADAEPPARPIYKSPLGVAVDPEGKRGYVVLNTADSVAVVDLQAGKVLAEIPVGKKPHDVALAAKSLFVTCERDDTLVRIDTDKQTVTGRWKTGQSPRGVAAMPDGSRVFVACHDENVIVNFHLATEHLQSIAIPGSPKKIALWKNPEDKIPRFLAICEIKQAAHFLEMSPDTNVYNGEILPIGLSNPQAFQVSAGAIVVHQKPRTNVPATQISQGWIFTNALTRFVPVLACLVPTSYPLDGPREAFADPSDIVIQGTDCFVSSAGAASVVVVKLDRLEISPPQKSNLKEYPFGKDHLENTRQYLHARLPTQSNPRRLALSANGKVLVASNYLSDSLTVIDAENLKVLRHIPLGGPKPDAARRGEILFNSGKMTFQGQFTCASCHPNGGSDGLNWDLARDGIGNFLNTRSLLGVKDTAPYGWHGSSTTLADRVAGTLRTLHKHEPQGTEVADIVAYLKTLDPPRPLPQTAKEKEAAVRGKTIFEAKGKCIQCHRPPVFDDQTAHDIGTRTDGDIKAQFDTPSLRGVGRTAPYLHHGQAETLEDVFTRHNRERRHGAAHELTPAELADLVAYLKSL